MEERRRRSERNREIRQAESSSVEKTMEPETKYGVVVDCSYLNFRRNPDRTDPSNVIDIIPRNTKVQINNAVRDMLEVTLEDGRTGFIAAAYCEEV